MPRLTEQHIQQRRAALLGCFETIQRERMTDVPLLNNKLSIDAVGFRHWNGYALGVLITPWVMKLMALPLLKSELIKQTRSWQFPSGEYRFEYDNIDGLGECYSCSLFSPMQAFADQAAARATAEAVMQALFEGEQDEKQKITDQITQQALNRRQFLRGQISG